MSLMRYWEIIKQDKLANERLLEIENSTYNLLDSYLKKVVTLPELLSFNNGKVGYIYDEYQSYSFYRYYFRYKAGEKFNVSEINNVVKASTSFIKLKCQLVYEFEPGLYVFEFVIIN